MTGSSIYCDIAAFMLIGTILGLFAPILCLLIAFCFKKSNPNHMEYIRASKILFKNFKYCVIIIGFLYFVSFLGFI